MAALGTPGIGMVGVFGEAAFSVTARADTPSRAARRYWVSSGVCAFRLIPHHVKNRGTYQEVHARRRVDTKASLMLARPQSTCRFFVAEEVVTRQAVLTHKAFLVVSRCTLMYAFSLLLLHSL